MKECISLKFMHTPINKLKKKIKIRIMTNDLNSDSLTQKVIDIISNSSQCMESIKQVPCDDYQARFGAFIRVKHGIITTNLIDWTTVMQTIKPTI
jgi:hypothetical protein